MAKKPAPLSENETQLDLGHFSLQFSDTKTQKQADVNKIFTRNYDAITGTEAGEEPLTGMLRAAAKKHGYTFYEYKSNWVAINRSICKRLSYRKGAQTIIDNDLVVGPGHDSNIVWGTFTHKDPGVGRISILCSHYPTKGRPDAKDAARRVNIRWTKKLALAVGAKARVLGKGVDLVFYQGDQNIDDAVADTFFGAPLTSAQDELDQHEKTHWAQIDVSASFNGDGRVRALYVRALDDKELHMFSDHYPLEAGYAIRKFKKTK